MPDGTLSGFATLIVLYSQRQYAMRPSPSKSSFSSSTTSDPTFNDPSTPPFPSSSGARPGMQSRSSSASLITTGNDDLPQLSYEQTNLLRTLREQLRELRPPLASKFDAILILFQTLKNDEPVMAMLLRYYRQHPDVIRLGDQLSTFVEHFAGALESTNVHYRIDPGSLQFEHLQTCFDGLGVCVPNK